MFVAYILTNSVNVDYCGQATRGLYNLRRENTRDRITRVFVKNYIAYDTKPTYFRRHSWTSTGVNYEFPIRINYYYLLLLARYLYINTRVNICRRFIFDFSALSINHIRLSNYAAVFGSINRLYTG